MKHSTLLGGYQTRCMVNVTDFGGGVVEAKAIERIGRFRAGFGDAPPLLSDRTEEEPARTAYLS